MLSANNLVDFLCSTLGQKDLAVAQELVVNQHILSSRKVQRSSARTQDDNGNQDIVGTRLPSPYLINTTLVKRNIWIFLQINILNNLNIVKSML